MLIVKRDLKVFRPIEEVWPFVKKMSNWAAQMPGYISHEEINTNDSIWILRVNLGPFTRPIIIEIHVEKWEEPTHVAFTLKGRSDPFIGKGSFHAAPCQLGSDIHLEFTAEPTGSMSKLLTAMAAPVLETIGTQFSENLKLALDGSAAIAQAPGGAKVSFFRRLIRTLARFFYR